MVELSGQAGGGAPAQLGAALSDGTAEAITLVQGVILDWLATDADHGPQVTEQLAGLIARDVVIKLGQSCV
jgi:hypothetical protein